MEATAKSQDTVREGFTSLVPKGEGGGDPIKLRPLTVVSQIYRIWAGVRMEDAMKWQETWAHEQSYAFQPHRGSRDAAAVLTLLIELSHVMKTLLAGVGTEYTKCFDLIPQAIWIAMLDIQGMEKGLPWYVQPVTASLQNSGMSGRVVESTGGEPPRVPAQRHSDQCADVHMEESDR